ncbi:UNVERIFIED_CONTAM: hypothetical protein GTU68_003999 [Idotea baltica]|nr:hypothetical protein [Idotea baltica]
MGRLTPR